MSAFAACRAPASYDARHGTRGCLTFALCIAETSRAAGRLPEHTDASMGSRDGGLFSGVDKHNPRVSQRQRP